MSGRLTRLLGGLWRFPLVSPRGFLIAGAVLAAAFAVAHALGWREHASVVCGQWPGDSELAAASGAAYVLAWFAFVLVAPVLGFAAAIFAALLRGLGRRPPPAPQERTA